MPDVTQNDTFQQPNDILPNDSPMPDNPMPMKKPKPQEKKPRLQGQPQGGNGGAHRHNPRQHSMENVQPHPGMTAAEIQRQIQQAVDAKLENKGVNANVEKINGMLTRANPDFAHNQAEASAAVNASAKAHENDKIMRDDASKAFADAVHAVHSSKNDMFIKPIPKKQSNVFGMETDNKPLSGNKKVLSSGPRADKPVSAMNIKQAATEKYPTTIADNESVVDDKDESVINLGTKTSNTPSQEQPAVKPEAPDNPITNPNSVAAGKVNIYFVPNLGSASDINKSDMDITNIAVGGRSKQVASPKFMPVIYLDTNKAKGYEHLNIPGVGVKDGFAQVDAYDYAKKNNVELKDIIDETRFSNMLTPVSKDGKLDCRIARKPYQKNENITPFSFSKDNITINVPCANNQNAYEYCFASNLAGQNISVDDVLKSASKASIIEDKKANQGIYDDYNALSARMTKKNNIMHNKSLSREERAEAYQQLDEDFTNKQRDDYRSKGLGEKAIEHLEKIGYVGVDAARFKSHVALNPSSVESMKDLQSPNHAIVEGAGKFTISSDSDDTDFAGYLMSKKDDMLGYLGDKFGTPEESKDQNIYISTPQTVNGVSTCVLVYDGFKGENVDAMIRKQVSDVLNEYGDAHAKQSNMTYAVEQDELDVCKNHYSDICAPYSVHTYDNSIQTPVNDNNNYILDESLDAHSELDNQKDNAGLSM